MPKNAKRKTQNSKLDRKRELARERQRRHRERQGSGVKGPGSGKGAAVATEPQISAGAPQGMLTSWFNQFVFRKVDGYFYEALREGIPIFDAAIRRLISLNGTIKIIGDNAPLVKELEDFCLNVPVNDMQKGIHAFKENSENEVFEQGFAISEFIANAARDDIDRLLVADSKNIIFHRNEAGRAEPWYRWGYPLTPRYDMPADIIREIMTARYGHVMSYNGVNEVKLNLDNKLYFSINNENQDPYGVSIFRSTEFVSQIMVTLQNSMKNVAERFGDPSYHVHLAAAAGDKNLADRKTAITNEFNTIITAKRQGQSGDFFTAAGPNSTVTVNAIGPSGQVISYDIPLRHVLEQIVAKTSLPAWMLGIYWSTTERMATLEVEVVLADAKIRQAAMTPEYLRLFSNFLKLRGRTWKSVTTSLDKPGDWGFILEVPNVRDMVMQAQAEFLSAEAAQLRNGIQGTSSTIRNNINDVPVGAASFETADGMKFEVGRRGQGARLKGPR